MAVAKTCLAFGGGLRITGAVAAPVPVPDPEIALPPRIAFPVWCPLALQPALHPLLQPFAARLAVTLHDEAAGFAAVADLPDGSAAAGLILYTPLATALTAAQGDLAGAAAAWQARMQALPDLAAARPALLLAETDVLATAAAGLQALIAARQGGAAPTNPPPTNPPLANPLLPPTAARPGLAVPSPLADLLAAAVAQALPGLASLLARLAAAHSPVPGHAPAACDPATLQALRAKAGQWPTESAPSSVVLAPVVLAPVVLDRALHHAQARAMALDGTLAARDAAIAALAQDIARRDAALLQAAVRAQAGEAEVQALRTSHSWRVTAPLRAVSLLARRLRPGRG